VTAGDDVAFAHALLRCSTRETLQKHPDKRLPYVAVDDVDGTGVVGADRLDSTCLLEVR
jgi:hypothetical protein